MKKRDYSKHCINFSEPKNGIQPIVQTQLIILSPLHRDITVRHLCSKSKINKKNRDYLQLFHEYKKHTAAVTSQSSNLQYLHPGKLTWNLKMNPWKRRFLLETIIFRFHVSFRGVNSTASTLFPTWPGSPRPPQSCRCHRSLTLALFTWGMSCSNRCTGRPSLVQQEDRMKPKIPITLLVALVSI